MSIAHPVQTRCFLKLERPNSQIKEKPADFPQCHLSIPRFMKTLTKVSLKSSQLTRHHVLDDIPESDTFAWNSLIRYHLNNKDSEDDAISVYHQMLLRGVLPDKYTFPIVLGASLHAGSPFFGMQVHGHALKWGFGSDSYVITGLMTMYGQFENFVEAHRVFNTMPSKNTVAWTLLVALYISANRPIVAWDVFLNMLDSGIKVDEVAMTTAIEACMEMKSLYRGRHLHGIARKNELEFKMPLANSLLKMYIDCGSIEEAKAFFLQIPTKDVYSWTSIISGYVQRGLFNEGLKLLQAMHSAGAMPDSFAISSVLPACARITANKNGKEIHGYVIRNAIELNVSTQNALMDMYVKSGFLDSAAKIFAGMVDKDVVSWTVMIMGYSLHGHGLLGVDLFQQMMQQYGIEPDQKAYFAVLHACNTACLVDEGKAYLNCIKDPQPEHYALMVNLLSRAGLFDEIRSFVEKHKIGKHVEVLRALLDGCRIRQNIKLGKKVAEQLLQMDPLNAENYLLLSNFYSATEDCVKAEAVRQMITDMGLVTHRAYSWIEVRNKTHAFCAGDVTHPRSKKIYWEIKVLMEKMEKEGCTSQ